MDEQEKAALEAKQAQDLADAKEQARKDEQARVSGILNCEEAKGNHNLANHLAFNTQQSVEEAKQMLSAAKLPESAAAPAPKQDADKPNPFKEAMNGDQHPNLGAGGEEGGDGQESAAQFILKSQAAATGRKLNS